MLQRLPNEPPTWKSLLAEHGSALPRAVHALIYAYGKKHSGDYLGGPDPRRLLALRPTSPDWRR